MLKKFFISSLFALTLFSGCKNIDPGARIMLIGDSWAQLMCVNNSFGNALTNLGITTRTGINCQLTTLIGTTSAYWSNNGRLATILSAMSVSKNLEMVYISLGGNDMLGVWHVGMSEEEEIQYFTTVENQILKIVDSIHAVRPKVKIVLSSYDYVNFQYFLKHQTVPSYIEIYNRMGQPTAAELNAMSARLEKYKAIIPTKRSFVTYVNNMGLMQYFYGQSEFGVAPRSTALPGQAPNFSPFMGGLPELPGPHEAFTAIPVLNITDPYHLSKTAFELFAENILKVSGY
jgi:lysophospholipase L1-like esterase